MKKTIVALSIVLFSTSVLLGCGSEGASHEEKTPQQAQEQQDTQKVSLKRWEGRWTSLETIISTSEAMKVAEEEAKKEGVDKTVLIDSQKKRLMSPATMVEIKEDSIILYKEKDKLSESSYQYIRSQMAKRGTDETHWDIFKADDKNSNFPFIALSETHGDEGYAHFHAKFAKSEAELFNETNNDPTFIVESTPIEVMAEEVFE